MSLFGPSYSDLERIVAVGHQQLALIEKLRARVAALEAKQVEIDSRLPYKPFYTTKKEA